MLLAHPLGDQGAVARLGVALDAEQGSGTARRQGRDDRGQIGVIEALGGGSTVEVVAGVSPHASGGALPALPSAPPRALESSPALLVAWVIDQLSE